MIYDLPPRWLPELSIFCHWWVQAAKRRNFDGIFSTGAFSFSMDFFRQKNDGKITTEKFRHLKKWTQNFFDWFLLYHRTFFAWIISNEIFRHIGSFDRFFSTRIMDFFRLSKWFNSHEWGTMKSFDSRNFPIGSMVADWNFSTFVIFHHLSLKKIEKFRHSKFFST